MQGLFFLTSLSGYSAAYNSISSSALKVLMEKYGSSIDSGLIAAITIPNSKISQNISEKDMAKKNIEDENSLVKSYKLYNNYPNPFNPTTRINYQIPSSNYVTLKVYDILGNLVKTLVDGYKAKGKYSINFDASSLARGIYFYQLKAGEFNSFKKMLLVK